MDIKKAGPIFAPRGQREMRGEREIAGRREIVVPSNQKGMGPPQETEVSAGKK